MGDPDEGDNDIEQQSREIYKRLRYENDTQDDKLDMEPLHVLIEMSRDPTLRYVDGAIQIAKVYKSGTSEFFGVYWPSIEGEPHFQGRTFSRHHKPEARYFDPDTLELTEDQLPVLIRDITPFRVFEEFDFIRECYSDEGSLRPDLTTTTRERLISIFREIAYSVFMRSIDGEGHKE